MKLLMCLMIIFSSASFAQTNGERALKCSKTKNISRAKRLSRFPFSESYSVKFVSLKSKSKTDVEFDESTDLVRKLDSIVIGKTIFQPKQYTEVTTASSDQIDSLTDIIFNYGKTRKTDLKVIIGSFYQPNNAILFLDKNEIIMGFIEVSFVNEHFRSNNRELLNLGDYCSEKYEMLAKVFSNSGIRYGLSLQ